MQDLIRELRTSLPSLRPSEQRVATFTLSDPRTAVELATISDLAERCDTSVASVTRLCRSLGYAGYSDFRRSLASSLGREQESLRHFGVSDGNVGEDDDAQAVVSKIAFHEASAIQQTAAALDLTTLDAVADAIVAAPRIDIYGLASSAIAATDLQQKLHRIGLVTFCWADVHIALTSAAVLAPGCVAVAFSHSGRTVEVAEVLSGARKRGATTVLVTNFPDSPVANESDFVLQTSASETLYRPGAMSSRIAQLAVIDFLFVRIAQRLPEGAEDLLERTFDAVQGHRISRRRSAKT